MADIGLTSAKWHGKSRPMDKGRLALFLRVSGDGWFTAGGRAGNGQLRLQNTLLRPAVGMRCLLAVGGGYGWVYRRGAGGGCSDSKSTPPAPCRRHTLPVCCGGCGWVYSHGAGGGCSTPKATFRALSRTHVCVFAAGLAADAFSGSTRHPPRYILCELWFFLLGLVLDFCSRFLFRFQASDPKPLPLAFFASFGSVAVLSAP